MTEQTHTKTADAFIRAIDLGDKHANNAQAIVSSLVPQAHGEKGDPDAVVAIAKRIEAKYPGKEKAKERNNKLSKLRMNLKRSFDKETDDTFWTVKKVEWQNGKDWAVVNAEWPEPDPNRELEKAIEKVAENFDKTDVQRRLLALFEDARNKAA